MEASIEAGPGSVAAIEVDFTALAQLVAAIRQVAGELADNGALCGQMNDPDLAGVFDRVERNWRKERVTLQTYLDEMARSVTASLAGYRDVEFDLAAAAARREQR